MMRFVDLTEIYWTDPEEETPVCAFLSTTSDTFLSNRDGSDIFSTLAGIEDHLLANRLLGLVPKGFFERESMA